MHMEIPPPPQKKADKALYRIKIYKNCFKIQQND